MFPAVSLVVQISSLQLLVLPGLLEAWLCPDGSSTSVPAAWLWCFYWAHTLIIIGIRMGNPWAVPWVCSVRDRNTEVLGEERGHITTDHFVATLERWHQCRQGYMHALVAGSCVQATVFDVCSRVNCGPELVLAPRTHHCLASSFSSCDWRVLLPGLLALLEKALWQMPTSQALGLLLRWQRCG